MRESLMSLNFLKMLKITNNDTSSVYPVFNVVLMNKWWSKKTIVVVTRGNRGIGFKISRQLVDHGVIVIVLNQSRPCKLSSLNSWTSNNEAKLEALDKLFCAFLCCFRLFFHV